MAHPIIIYVPGLLPKPEPAVHRDALSRCLLRGIERVDPEIAGVIENTTGAFDIVSWTYDFYLEHRDFELDRAAIDNVIENSEADASDIGEATAWTRRLTLWIYRLGDRLPFLIPHIATERMAVHLRDLQRYVKDENGIAEHVRRMLKVPLRAAAKGGHPVLLIGHSMGSVICWDTLWQLSREQDSPVAVDLWLTMGSPLGQRFIRKRIKGARQSGRDRYPANIRRWANLAAVGDMTAIDPWLADDFSEMVDLGLVEAIDDDAIYN
ncbi:MAG: hypothetical protein AAFN50_04845, partial [Pseudomonadota bacterium]